MSFAFGKPALRLMLSPKILTYGKSYKNNDFYYEVEDSETKLMKETPVFTRFNAIVTSLNSLDPDYSSKNHVRKFLCALPLKWRTKLTAIKEAKDLATLPLDYLFENLKVYEIILENDGIVSKTTTKDKVKSLALKAKVTREQNNDDSDSQGGRDKDVNEEEEADAFNLMASNI
ncbi:hypothetical protein Tco_0702256 [Tanacetum coccineum]|uniref:UBN2 domain-containing protein n=1 Tax=Tanacetum coccineum TaxID=301880 RepID=A0ABQ4XX63_9ASTR